MVGHKNFPAKEILEKFPQKSCSGMGKGNSYHAHVSYPDCRIFLSHIPSIRRKKKTMFSSLFHHFSSWQAALSALKARPSRNICTRGVTFISHHHRPAPCTEIKVSSKDIGQRWKFAYLSNVYSNFPLNNFYSRSNSLSSTPPLSAVLIRVLNIQARNHFVCGGEFEYKTWRINIFWSVMGYAKGLICKRSDGDIIFHLNLAFYDHVSGIENDFLVKNKAKNWS